MSTSRKTWYYCEQPDCGFRTPSYAAAERHLDRVHHGGRMRIDQPELSPARLVTETRPL